MASPSQLFSCVDAQLILKSPVNDSTAKTHYSFAKDSRFKRPKTYCDSFYQIPGMQKNDKRKAGTGYGKKTDLDVGKHPHNQTPPPDTYNLKSFVETNKKDQRGFSPLYSRQETAPMSYIDLEQGKVPGPGRYDQFRYNETPKWSMRPQTARDLFPKTTALEVPPPSHYNYTEELGKNLTGKYYLSNHRNSKAAYYHKGKRFNNSATDVPGPGNYKPQNDLSREGKYVLSRNKSAGKRAILDGRRQSFIDLTKKSQFTPGPGSYRTPSDFGHYDNKRERQIRLSKSQMLAKSDKMTSAGKVGFS